MADILELLVVATLDSGNSSSYRSRTPSKSHRGRGGRSRARPSNKPKTQKRSMTPADVDLQKQKENGSKKKLQMFRDDSALNLHANQIHITPANSSVHEDDDASERPLLNSSVSIQEDESEGDEKKWSSANPKVSNNQIRIVLPAAAAATASAAAPAAAKPLSKSITEDNAVMRVGRPGYVHHQGNEMKKIHSEPQPRKTFAEMRAEAKANGQECVIPVPKGPDCLELDDVASPERKTRVWKSSLCCSWTDQFGFCCYSCICPCKAFGDNVEATRGEQGKAACMSYCMVNMCCMGFMLASIERSFVRKKLGIQASCGGCEDFCVHLFCNSCAMTQMKEEIEHEKEQIREVLFNAQEEEMNRFTFSSSMKKIVSAPRYLEG
eukprot:TRINITY_DN2407_c0_g1_i1.p1 TRINITY_DN2407_c0_g1~~TRINITY_DN2407_c0_g1_i1.p1  ORF type:complete len:380 (-),score=83.99 TRINITY_DN2407_c0_g1_i1:154-1293(-)